MGDKMDKIRKRNGSLVDFDSIKILSAINKANKAVVGEKMSSTDLSYLTEKVVAKIDMLDECSVEQVQDIVEEMLIKYDYAKTAKAYILYRAEHTKTRQAESDLKIGRAHV